MQHRILIAEDDTDISRLLSRILEAQGYQTLQAFSGTEALSLIEHEEPDLLLLDLMLPGLSGEELLCKLREEKRCSFPLSQKRLSPGSRLPSDVQAALPGSSLKCWPTIT